ncbi:MAG: tRNA (N6-isopentenyl adenosine(37)-C2)-methylthiotransferase MiaB [Clostridia bacterium]|nr:tRNA (N6-isopentenyl adenosine(37)-C2)-methylthiotransferase MiaB [Clostridia bacterium]
MTRRIEPAETGRIAKIAERIKEYNDRIAAACGKPRTACVHTFGCQMNEHDSEKLKGMLGAMGYTIVPEYSLTKAGGVPDVIVFNTCCVRENAEDKIFGQIGAVKGAKKLREDLIVAVCGCMTEQQWAVERIRKSYKHVDIVFGTGNAYRFPEFIAARLFDGRRVIGAEPEDSVPEGVPVQREEKFRAYVTVMYGCDNFCSYCIVPYVRGRERSRRADDVVNEVKELAAAGTREVMLLGQNVNSYGKDRPDGDASVDFAGLIRRVCRETGIERVRFMTSHPKDLSPELIRAVAEEPKVCRQLHLPVQSGSTSELKRMNRKYTREQYIELVRRVREAVPDVTLTTDIMIGFPGETEEEFADTLRLVEEVRFDNAFTFIYSRRQGTPAAERPDQVPEEVVKRRFGELLEAQNRISREKNEALLGQTLTVLCEGPSKTNPERLTGRTEGNKVVNFVVPAGLSVAEGQFADVRIETVQTWSLEGTAVDKKLSTGSDPVLKRSDAEKGIFPVRDRFFMLKPGSVKLGSDVLYHRKLLTVQNGLMKTLDFRALADFYREKRNQFAAGEFWGKIMRAAAMIYSYTGETWLRDKMRAAVDDLLSIQGEDGEISTAPKAEQPNGSGGADLWERKYVMLGLLEYYRVTDDAAERARVKQALSDLLDYTISQVGEGEGQTPILATGWAFCGIESSSILEPVVKVYGLTGKPEHLAFAEYIVRAGGCSRENIFDAIRAGKSPFRIGDNGDPRQSIAKAYEMMSCFEGLTEFYRVTGRGRDREAVLKLFGKLMEEEITELGSGGADGPFNLGPGTGEQWNRTRFEQANPDLDLMMETCVTVTWMKLNLQLLRLAGDARFADNIEVSALNALCAALRPDGLFFEYFPRFNGARNPKVNFSYNVGGFDLSCCTANGPMGLGIVPYVAFMQSDIGPVINFYVDGFARFGKMTVNMRSAFPQEGKAALELGGGAYFTGSILLRIPEYARLFSVTLNGRGVELARDGRYPGYAVVPGPFAEGMLLEVSFDIKDRMVLSGPSVNPAGNGLALLKHGPVVLARDNSVTDIDRPVAYAPEPVLEPLPPRRGAIYSCGYSGCEWQDYQSAGAGWVPDSRFVTWNRVISENEP